MFHLNPDHAETESSDRFEENGTMEVNRDARQRGSTVFAHRLLKSIHRKNCVDDNLTRLFHDLCYWTNHLLVFPHYDLAAGVAT
jgi:hypothetical protein